MDLYRKYRVYKDDSITLLSKERFYTKAMSKTLKSILSSDTIRGDLIDLPNAISVIDNFSIEYYLSSSYDCQLFVDYLTRKPKIKFQHSVNYLRSFIKGMLVDCKVSGTLDIALTTQVRGYFQADNGKITSRLIQLSGKPKKSKPDKYPSRIKFKSDKELCSYIEKNLLKGFNSLEGFSDKVNHLHSLRVTEGYNNSLFDLTSHEIGYFDTKVELEVIVISYLKRLKHEEYVSEDELSIASLTIDFSLNTGDFSIKESKKLSNDFLTPQLVKTCLGEKTYLEQGEGIVKRINSTSRSEVGWGYNPNFMHYLKAIIKVEASRRVLGEYYVEALELLLEDRNAFEQKYLSNPVDIYDFYKGLSSVYRNLATGPKGLFFVKQLKRKEDNFTSEEVREALKYIRNTDKEFKKERQLLKRSASGIGIRI